MDTNGTDTVRRVLYFNHQLLQVQDFSDEQAYHIRMRRTHNRLMHSWGVLEGLELHLDTRAQRLTVEEGTALDARGCEIVLPREEQFELSPYAGRTVWVTIAYRENNVGGEPAPARGSFSRVEEVPALSLDESPPADPGLRLVLGRLAVAGDGTATLDDGEVPNRRRNAGGAGGDLEGRALTLSSAGDHPTTWPRLRMSAQHTVEVEGSLDVTGALSAGEGLRVGGGAVVAGPLGVGTTAPEGTLQVINAPQDANGTTLVLGPTTGSNLRLGYHQDYSWVQSHGLKPLRINELGNDVSVGARLGLGTHQPTHPLHVAGEDAVALFESRGSSAYLRVATREGIDNRVELANRPGGRLALWVAGGGDVVNVTRDGRLGVGTDSPTHRFHVRADDAVGLFESIGEQAYLRVATREGMDHRVELANRPGGRLALWVAAGGDALNVTREGAVGIGTQQPQARLHVAGDLVVDGEIRSRGTGGRSWATALNGLAFPGSIGIGTAEPRAKLHLLHTPQDSNGDALQIGDETGSNLRLGYHQDYSWIQSHGLKPLRINEMGNDVIFSLGGGNVGIGAAPTARLHVKGDVFVDGAIRTPAGELLPGGGGGGGGGGIGTPARIDFSVALGQKLNLWQQGYAIGIQKMTQYYRSDGSFAWFRGGTHADEPLDPGAGGTGMMVLNSEGRLGIGTTTPTARLHVQGDVFVDGAIRTPAGELLPGGGGGGGGIGTPTRIDFSIANGHKLNLWKEEYAIGIQHSTQYFRSSGNFAWFRHGVHADGQMEPGAGGTGMMVLNSEGSLGLGTTAPRARLEVAGGAIMPSAGNNEQSGILFPPDAGGGAADRAYLRYYSRSGHDEAMTLELGIQNDGDDHIALMPSGNVGVGTLTPTAKLEVAGDAVVGGKRGERFVLHTRTQAAGDFLQIAPDDAAGNWEWQKGITFRRASGNVGIGVTDPQALLHVAGDVFIGGKIRTPAGELRPGEGGAVLAAAPADGGVGRFDRIDFGTTTSTKLNLWGEQIATGVQDFTQYQRSSKNFAWFLGGAHDNGELNPGTGGRVAMVLREGRLGVGTTGPRAAIEVAGGAIMPSAGNNEQSGILFPPDAGGGAADRAYLRYYSRSGKDEAMTLELGIQNDGNDHIALMPAGSLGVGIIDPTHRLHVKGPENIALLESTGTQAYVRVSTAEGMDNRVEFCNRPGGRLALWTAGAGDGFNVLRDGRTGVGTVAPEGKMQVINAPQDSNGTTLILGPMGGANLRMGYHNDYSWIQSHGLKPLRINEMGNDVIVSPGGGNVGIGTLTPAAKLHVKGNMVIEGNLEVRGSKGGYLADQFVNATGEALEEGDVVVIGSAQTTLFYGYGETRNIPIPEVDPAEKTADARVCGVVASVYGFDDSGEGLAPVSTARRKRGDAPATGADVAAGSDDPRQVGPGQRGMMVTVGAFAHCKVDADLGAIEVGDLLTTSPTRGHAQKVTDPAQAIGAIIGKALAPLKKGQGKIPVMVMLQ